MQNLTVGWLTRFSQAFVLPRTHLIPADFWWGWLLTEEDNAEPEKQQILRSKFTHHF
jgi:hypothetical protein